MQKVTRPTNRSFYINFPCVLADALNVQKGEVFEWSVVDNDTFLLKRAASAERPTTRHQKKGAKK
ncbi:MAG: hypothetical protein M9963_08995 [Kiritimatiellae bacterium]|nr:hypothetical protein [Kiritimatiellia bacterium]